MDAMMNPFFAESRRVRKEIDNLRGFKPSSKAHRQLSPQRRAHRFDRKAAKIEEALGRLKQQESTPEEKQRVEELERQFTYARYGDVMHALAA